VTEKNGTDVAFSQLSLHCTLIEPHIFCVGFFNVSTQNHFQARYEL